MPTTEEYAYWQQVIDGTDYCPFCGRTRGQRCGRVEATYSPALPDLVKPHQPRIDRYEELRARHG